ncbi:MAG: hypothetical protein WC197_00065 [Candidatus Gastranaerophilaceae bacterium]|jgi:hypothetical protein
MTLRTRKILYFTFLLAFFIITPLLFLYAAGYKIGSNLSFEKTGILIIDTNPPNAEIYLNGKIQQKFLKKIFSQEESNLTTPIKIKGLLPGEYDIKLTLNNYWPWEKKLKILPGQSTFIEDVILFKIDLPLILQNGNFDSFSLSPDNKYLIGNNPEMISRTKLSDDSNSSYLSTSTNALLTDTISWSPDGQKFIANNHLFNLNEWGEPISLEKIIGKNIHDLKWNPSEDNKIYYSSNGSAYVFDLAKDISKRLIDEMAFTDFLPKDNFLYFVTKKENEVSLNAVDLDSQKQTGKTNLPSSDYVFINQNNRFLNLYDTLHNILYIIDPKSAVKPLKETINNIKIAKWVDENRLIHANDFEIWLLDINTFNRTLITRVSHQIKDIFWHPNNNYIIYTTDKQINIIELDNRDKYNITKIIELDSIKSPY